MRISFYHFFFPLPLLSAGSPIGMFDFTQRNLSSCSSNTYEASIDNLAVAVLRTDTAKELPEQMTICSTIFLDIDDCDRNYPTWALQDLAGRANLSVTVARRALGGGEVSSPDNNTEISHRWSFSNNDLSYGSSLW